MRTPAVIVLFAALVHSIFGTTSEDTADHNIMPDTAVARPNILYNRDQYIMTTERTNRLHRNINNNFELVNNLDIEYIFPEDHIIVTNLEIHKRNVKILWPRDHNPSLRRHGQENENEDASLSKRVKRQEIDQDPKCEDFRFVKEKGISSPKDIRAKTYPNNTNCVTIINATTDVETVKLTFVDVFHIEYHPECAYDYLEIRDGFRGYADLLGKFCGESFPPQIISSGPSVWLKFFSDDTIEYDGFHINVEFVNTRGRTIPDSCYKELKDTSGTIDSKEIDPDCLEKTAGYPLDVLWKIETETNMKIYLNFTKYNLASPNECEQNVIQVFGSLLEYEAKLAQYCGSVAETITTKGDGIKDKGYIMYVRMFASKTARSKTYFEAKYTAYRTLDPTKDEKCIEETEFDCEDNTCIDIKLVCNNYANCRLKTDEEASCSVKAESMLSQPHIQVVLVIFSLILSGMSFVFLFRCIRKLYQDHKIIKEHIRQSCEDRLDNLVASRLTLDAKKLQRDSEPRASLERDNHTNEMYKKQRKLSQMKSSSIDSDFIQNTHLDPDDENWRHEVECVPEIIDTEDIRIERNGRTRRSDLSKREESIRSKTKDDEAKVKKEIRDVSVGAPDTKESGCQTRESLFQVESPTGPSSDGSGTNSRGFSTFGYSGATIARPSPPAPTTTSQITIELIKQASHDSSSKKKFPDRRPMSTETTRSAPDVIIVSKPLR